MKRGRLRAQVRTLVANALPTPNRAVTSGDRYHAAKDIAASVISTIHRDVLVGDHRNDASTQHQR
jgi:hypothetical protein